MWEASSAGHAPSGVGCRSLRGESSSLFSFSTESGTVTGIGASSTEDAPLEAARRTPMAMRVKRRLNHGKIATSFTTQDERVCGGCI